MLSPNQSLIVPPGYVVFCMVQKGEVAYGFRKAFVPANDSARANFEILHRAYHGNAAAAKFLHSTVDALKVALATGSSRVS